jgi:hypothetical protein
MANMGLPVMRFAYADPPYVGQARKHYGREEVPHGCLISHLVNAYPDGWALSCSSPSLTLLLPMCPDDVRVMAWVKPFCSFRPGVGVAYAWEPVIVRGGRRRTREQETVRDWVSVNITLRRGLTGVKPDEFCFWLFAVLNMVPGDEFVDLFLGSGAVSRAWERWRHRLL